MKLKNSFTIIESESGNDIASNGHKYFYGSFRLSESDFVSLIVVTGQCEH